MLEDFITIEILVSIQSFEELILDSIYLVWICIVSILEKRCLLNIGNEKYYLYFVIIINSL